jgi:hypothetical protein
MSRTRHEVLNVRTQQAVPMFSIIALSRLDNGLLFWTEAERRAFLACSLRLAARWGVQVCAFHLCGSEVEFLVKGTPKPIENWLRLVHSSHSTSLLQGQGRRIRWARPEVHLISDPRRVARNLHGLDPWNQWTSLWDAAGLRRIDCFKATWLKEQASPQTHFREAGGPALTFGNGPLAPATWEQITRAVDLVTWQLGSRHTRVLITQLAYRAGWGTATLAAMLGVGPAAVRKSLSAIERVELSAAEAHLRHPALRAALRDHEPTVLTHSIAELQEAL